MSSNFFSAAVAAENLPDHVASPMNVSCDSDATEGPPKSRGRPSGSLNHSTVWKNQKQEAMDLARSKREAAAIKRVQVNVELEEERRAKEGPPLRTTSYLGPKVCAPMGKVPARLNRALSSDDIRHAIASITVLKERDVKSVFPLVSSMLDISETTLYDIWKEWVETQGACLPQSFLHVPRVRNASIIVDLFAGVIRAFIITQKLKGLVVEVPDIQKLLKDSHKHEASRGVIRRAMQKMGLKYGKKHKLMQNKEQENLTAKRKGYLEKKAAWQLKIDQRNAELAVWDAQYPGWGSASYVGPLLPVVRPRKLVFVFIDESYVNRNHSLGYTWFDPADTNGAAVFMASGKGERLVLLTAITEEFGLLNLEALDGDDGTLMIFQARKRTGDYHKNMNGSCFCTDWLTKKMIPALERQSIEAIFVMDIASYHLVPYPGSIDVDIFPNKKACTDLMDMYNIPYRAGTAPRGDTLDQLKQKTKDWLKINAHLQNPPLIVGVTHVEQLCKEHRHHLLLTPPYHPELQPIEKLWRNVKMFVAREYAGTRTMPELWQHVREAFLKYGAMEFCAKNVADARFFEELYSTEGAHVLSNFTLEVRVDVGTDDLFSEASDSSCSSDDED